MVGANIRDGNDYMTFFALCKSASAAYNAPMQKPERRIYMDYASAPPVCAESRAAMREAESLIGNPGGIHAEGKKAKEALQQARDDIARAFGVKSRELLFTSGLTESNNLAITGYARHIEMVRRSLEGTHWVVSAIEHASVLDCFGEIERLGGSVSHVQPDSRGVITPESVVAVLSPETVFVSVGWANNEIGVIQPLSDISRALSNYSAAHKTNIVFHTDAGQAPLYLGTAINSLGVDLFSLGINKMYGPHGVGVLWISPSVDIARVGHGGSQERGIRPGTENVELAVGAAAAVSRAVARRADEVVRARHLRDRLFENIAGALPQVVVNGDLRHALPHILNISLPHIQSEYVTLSLDAVGVAVSTKSACREGAERRSHVVAALGGEDWRATNTLRFSLGDDTTEEDVERVGQLLVKCLSVEV